jgi:hypothetical protein
MLEEAGAIPAEAEVVENGAESNDLDSENPERD